MKDVQRFVKYVKINTQADDTTGTTPSTEAQKDLGKVLVDELLELGLEDAHMDEFGNVYAHLPSRDEDAENIGLNAHMDTALEVTDKDVKPCLVKNYQGGVIRLANGLEMCPEKFPVLARHVGHDLIVTDGNTLLGADDKAGIAIIMSVLEYFHEHPEENHHNISVLFTVDEEIGEGPLHINYEKFNASYAYTIDGGDIAGISYENFNAKAFEVEVEGVSIHPGDGKGKLINALLVLNNIVSDLPQDQTPFDSEAREGYWHINDMSGNSEKASLSLILRDFEEEGIKARLEQAIKACEDAKEKFPGAKITYSHKDQYENMRPYVEKNSAVVDRATEALTKNGVEPVIAPIRGGTDGATMSKCGVPTPNLGTASFNHHGRFETLDIQDFKKMIKVVTDIVRK